MGDAQSCFGFSTLAVSLSFLFRLGTPSSVVCVCVRVFVASREGQRQASPFCSRLTLGKSQNPASFGRALCFRARQDWPIFGVHALEHPCFFGIANDTLLKPCCSGQRVYGNWSSGCLTLRRDVTKGGEPCGFQTGTSVYRRHFCCHRCGLSRCSPFTSEDFPSDMRMPNIWRSWEPRLACCSEGNHKEQIHLYVRVPLFANSHVFSCRCVAWARFRGSQRFPASTSVGEVADSNLVGETLGGASKP